MHTNSGPVFDVNTEGVNNGMNDTASDTLLWLCASPLLLRSSCSRLGAIGISGKQEVKDSFTFMAFLC